MASIQDYVLKFNNGDWEEFSNIFGDDVSKFLSLVKRRGFLDQIDIDSVRRFDNEQVNPTLKTLLELNPSFLDDIIEYNFSDIEKRSDGYYLKLSDLSELSEFFKSGGRYDDSQIVKNVMGEDWWEPYSDTVHNVYDEIIEVLNDKNLKELSSRILEIVGNQELSVDDYQSDLFEEISNDEGMFTINESNVMDIINDEDSMRELFSGVLGDLRNNLFNLGDNAHNQAYNDEVYENIWSELSTLFEGKHDWVTKQTKDGKTVYTPYVKIRDLYGDIMSYLTDFLPYNDPITDYGDYTSMKRYWMDQFSELLSFSDPGYPDHRRVEENINDAFVDYLY